MESTEPFPEAPVSPAKEIPAKVAGEEAVNSAGVTEDDASAEMNGTQNGNGHGHQGPQEQVEEPMDTSEPPAESGSTETTPVKTKAAMKDVSGLDEPAKPTEPTVLAETAEEDAEPVETAEEDAEPVETAEEDAEPVETAEEDVEPAKSGAEASVEDVDWNDGESRSQGVPAANAFNTEAAAGNPEEKTGEKAEEKSEEKTENRAEEKVEETSDEKVEEKTEDKNEEKDAFDAIGSGKPTENDKPKDAFDSMLSDGKADEPKDVEKPSTKVDEDENSKEVGSGDAAEEEKEKEDEVVTVEDDGKPFESEEAWLKAMPSDDEYFKSLDTEELEWYKEHGPKVETAGESGLKCTCCFKNVTLLVDSRNGVTRHFKLGVPICKTCKYFYGDGSGWEQDDEGLDKYCRWCAQGGEILICDKCPSAFCKRCLQRNLGRSKVADITNAEEWKCLICDPKQIYEQRALYHAVYQRFMSGNFRHEVRTRTPTKPKPRHEPVSKEEVEAVMKSPRNFVDENIFEAFKTLTVYQKCLEQERDRWIKGSTSLSMDNAVSTCRALRKIYAITKQNMDLLDKAIVQSFVEKYPKNSVKIHMGKVGVKVKEGSLTGKPVSVKSHTKVKLKAPKAPAKRKTHPPPPPPKRKILPKKKVSPKKGKTQEVVRPTLSKKKAGPASRTNKKQLYTKKKATRYSSDDDSDVVTLSSDDEKPTKPGPASRKRKAAATPIASPPKKRRPGPKSKTC